MQMFKLASVGCWLDIDTGDTWPALAEGGDPDYQAPACNLVDVEVDEWFDALSEFDRAVCNTWLAGYKVGEGNR